MKVRHLVALSALLLNSAAYAVNVNSADAVTIADELKGIGKVKAEAIVAYRTEHGPFTAVEALDAVKGIGPATIDKNRDKIELRVTKTQVK